MAGFYMTCNTGTKWVKANNKNTKALNPNDQEALKMND